MPASLKEGSWLGKVALPPSSSLAVSANTSQLCAGPLRLARDIHAHGVVGVRRSCATLWSAKRPAGAVGDWARQCVRGMHRRVWSGLQPCNPAVGGPAKSQLVHEVDALGGEIGRLADRCYLQKRVLNRSKVCNVACSYPTLPVFSRMATLEC